MELCWAGKTTFHVTSKVVLAYSSALHPLKTFSLPGPTSSRDKDTGNESHLQLIRDTPRVL